MLTRSPLQAMANINLQLIDSDNDLERLRNLAQLNQAGPAENKTPCIPYAGEG
jgi:hypothetical protein